MNAVVIDYGMGNVASVKKALDFLNIPNQLSSEISIIQDATHLILPGVGSFYQGMQNLHERNLTKILKTEVLVKNKPLLGICLGMQLLAEKGNEPIECEGLGVIRGEVLKITDKNYRIPHLGWNNITIKKKSNFNEFDGKDFYFIHSYHFLATDSSDILATVDYGNEYVAAIEKQHILATQFHPEKSQEAGLKFLSHFFTKNA
jgi:glutamine amidotransferase